MATETVYLITGANRGIGRAMVEALLLRPATVIVATVRDPAHETSASLTSAPKGEGSRLIVATLDVRGDFSSLQHDLKAAGVDHIDVAVSNAGNSESFVSVQETTRGNLLDDFEVNALGPFRLFQVCQPLLMGSRTGKKKFVLITSSVGSIAGLEMENMPGVSYGASKAAANWIAKKLNVEYSRDGLKVGIIHPGWVKTPMGQAMADAVHYSEPPMSIEDSRRSVLKLIDDLSEETSGKFLSYDGQELPW